MCDQIATLKFDNVAVDTTHPYGSLAVFLTYTTVVPLLSHSSMCQSCTKEHFGNTVASSQ